MRVARGRGSVLLLRRCNMLCTSGFVDDITVSYNGLYVAVTVPQQPRYAAWYGLHPVLDDGVRQD